jgi:hypothetical protein
MGGFQRKFVAALDASTGALTPWDPNANDPNFNGVYSLAVSGSVVYAGGNFTSVGGYPQQGIAAFQP